MNLLLAAVLLMQDKTAEETFKKIEECLANAKTVSLKFDCEATGAGEIKASGVLQLKEGNKVRIELKVIQRGRTIETLYLCDGETAFVKADYDPYGIRKRAPKSMKSNLLCCLTRDGMVHALYNGGGEAILKEWDYKKDHKVLELKAGVEDKSGTLLTFKLAQPYQPEVPEVNLLYDPKTLAPSQQISTLTIGTRVFRMAETYTDIVFDADIPDEKFKLPEEKK